MSPWLQFIYVCVSTHTLSELLRDVRRDLLVVGLKNIVYESGPWAGPWRESAGMICCPQCVWYLVHRLGGSRFVHRIQLCLWKMLWNQTRRFSYNFSHDLSHVPSQIPWLFARPMPVWILGQWAWLPPSMVTDDTVSLQYTQNAHFKKLIVVPSFFIAQA